MNRENLKSSFAKSSEPTDRLNFIWDPDATRAETRAATDNAAQPQQPRRFEDYFAFLEEVLPKDDVHLSWPGLPVDKVFEL